jgi:mannose-6-phosphate isomerase-like protein (cupin superfamily)
MVEIVIVKSEEVESTNLPGVSKTEKGAGWMKRIIYPPRVVTRGPFMGVAEVSPGYSVHRWHRHTKDQGEGYELVYPKDFQEIYYIASGTGVAQWKTEDGKMKEEKVKAGDTIFLPIGVPEHQLFNNGKEKMFVVFCGNPPPKATFTK